MSKHTISDVPTLLHKVPIFKSIAVSSLKKLVAAKDNGEKTYDTGEFVMRESEIANCMYILLEGRVSVIIRTDTMPIKEITISKLHGGDFFGEQALLPGSMGRRNAHIKALSDIKVFRIDKRYVEQAIKFNEEQGRRKEKTQDPLPVSAKVNTPGDEVRNVLLAQPLFRKHLKETELNNVGNWSKIVSFKSKDFIVKQFQVGEYLYLIITGSAEVFKYDKDGKPVVLAKLTSGNSVGQQSLIPGGLGQCNAYVRATSNLRAVRVQKKIFVTVFERSSAVDDGYATMPLASIHRTQPLSKLKAGGVAKHREYELR